MKISKSKRESNKQKILFAAVSCIVEKGLHQTSMRDIAEQAGFSIGNTYNYFSGKKALIYAIAEAEREELIDLLPTTTNPEDLPDLSAFLKTYYGYLCKPENVFLSAEFAAEATRSEWINQLFKKNRELVEQTVQAMIPDGISRSVKKSNAANQSRAIIDFLESAAYREVVLSERNRPSADKMILQLLNIA